MLTAWWSRHDPVIDTSFDELHVATYPAHNIQPCDRNLTYKIYV